MNYLLGRALVATTLTVTVTGCSMLGMAPKTDTPQVTISTTTSPASTPQAAIENAEQAMKLAEKEHLNFYAPFHNKQAKKALKQARKRLEKLETKESILDSINIFSSNSPQNVIDDANNAINNVNKGVQYKAIVKEELAPALEQVRRLDKLKARDHFPDQYRQALKELHSIIIDIERDNLDSAKEDQAPLVENMYALEVHTVEFITLNETRELIKRLEEADAEDYIPLLNFESIDMLNKAEIYIRANPRSLEEVKEIGERAYYVSLHAINVLNRVQIMSNRTHEEIILDFENLLAPLAILLDAKGIAHEDITKQAEQIQAAITDKKREIANLKEDALTQSSSAIEYSSTAYPESAEAADEANEASVSVLNLTPKASSRKDDAFAELEESMSLMEAASDEDLEISLDDLEGLLLQSNEEFESQEEQ